MKRGAPLGISIAAALIVTFFLVSRHYRLAVLTPTELALTLQKPPERPEDCAKIRRAMDLSAQSVVPGHEKLLRVTTPLDADETAIYKAVIQQWSSNERPELNVSAKTAPITVPTDVTSSSERTDCGCLSGISVESLLKASHSFHILTRSDLPGNNVRLVHPNEQMAMVNRNDPSGAIREGRSVSDAVENAVANGLFSMSEIAFDKERRYALVNYSFHCGLRCGSGAMWVFEKVNGEWKKPDRMCGGWIS